MFFHKDKVWERRVYIVGLGRVEQEIQINKFLYSIESLTGHLWVGLTCESLVSYFVISKI